MGAILPFLFLALLIIGSIVWLVFSDKIWAWLSRNVESSYVGNDINNY